VQVATSGRTRLFVDGAEVTAVEGIEDTQPSPGIAAFGLGMVADPTTAISARDIWFDELIVDTQPIGCLK
jgi:hypothetical protein